MLMKNRVGGTFVSRIKNKQGGIFTTVDTPAGKSSFMKKEVLDRAKRSANEILRLEISKQRSSVDGRPR